MAAGGGSQTGRRWSLVATPAVRTPKVLDLVLAGGSARIAQAVGFQEAHIFAKALGREKEYHCKDRYWGSSSIPFRLAWLVIKKRL